MSEEIFAALRREFNEDAIVELTALIALQDASSKFNVALAIPAAGCARRSKLKSKSIQWAGNKFTAKVELTIRKVTKEVVFTGELLGVQKVNFGEGAHMRAAYEATATINRKDFGLSFSGLAEGIAIVGDTVTLELSAEVSRPL